MSEQRRYSADGPQGHFETNDLELARALVNAYDKNDDWTITDITDLDQTDIPSEIEDVFNRLDAWSEAYPIEVFSPLKDEERTWLHETRPGLMDRIAASMGRHIGRQVKHYTDQLRKLIQKSQAFNNAWLTYVEPSDIDGSSPVYTTISRETAIKMQHAFAKTLEHSYESDEQALQDFMTVHWAWFTNDPQQNQAPPRVTQEMANSLHETAQLLDEVDRRSEARREKYGLHGQPVVDEVWLRAIDYEISVWAGRMSSKALLDKWPEAQAVHSALRNVRTAALTGATT